MRSGSHLSLIRLRRLEEPCAHKIEGLSKGNAQRTWPSIGALLRAKAIPRPIFPSEKEEAHNSHHARSKHSLIRRSYMYTITTLSKVHLDRIYHNQIGFSSLPKLQRSYTSRSLAFKTPREPDILPARWMFYLLQSLWAPYSWFGAPAEDSYSMKLYLIRYSGNEARALCIWQGKKRGAKDIAWLSFGFE